MTAAAEDTVLLGIGNVLWGDEGFGPRVVERMRERNAAPPDVRLVDGGTQGLYLLPLVQDAARLIVFDAVDFGRAPGEMVVLRDAEIPAFFGTRPLSLHQTGFTDVLAAAELTGRQPRAVTLIGVQYVDIDTWGGGLSPAVAAAIDPAIATSRRELQLWRESSHV
ncbi:hydrogenase expression/formation protein [Denitratisoma sp. DHT3]|uniref:HyaD/HybD family hydrogenase maturation endopeptidase n=1 Tax=Denitratisoma sp. DHT3 TaxID=1981880 RepID=UPI0011988FC4|nr:HyaD/HybD family hydrogenase maturation endopeptidase [Denitratisoma sp. DHT3]QDX80327.1 hydrogenase expression/formation protein [Denitratisoma sp. DHT3]